MKGQMTIILHGGNELDWGSMALGLDGRACDKKVKKVEEGVERALS